MIAGWIAFVHAAAANAQVSNGSPVAFEELIDWRALPPTDMVEVGPSHDPIRCCRGCNRRFNHGCLSNKRSRIKLRRFSLQPENLFGTVQSDPGILREWYFENAFTQVCHWQFTESDERSLKNYFYQERWIWTGDLRSDLEFFWSRQGTRQLAGLMVAGGILANTDADESINQWMIDQGWTRPGETCWQSEFGNGNYTIPVTLTAWLLSRTWQLHHDSPAAATVEHWSYRTTRSYLIGTPAVLVLQRLTGGSRPGESSSGSRWKPFDDENGVSGHSFMGAVPFLVAAKMSRRPLVKTALFAGSGIAAYGRLCDNGHYFSQVLMGWGLAYLSVEAITQTDCCPTRYRLVPMDVRGNMGFGIEVRR